MLLHLARRSLPLGLLLAAACHGTGPAPEIAFNRLKWITHRPAAYTYEFQRLCFCIPEAVARVRISVAGGAVQAVVTSAGDPVPPADVDRYFRITIDSLFDILEDAARHPADHMTVTYDSRLGYPAEAFIDYELGAADEELGFRAALLAP